MLSGVAGAMDLLSPLDSAQFWLATPSGAPFWYATPGGAPFWFAERVAVSCFGVCASSPVPVLKLSTGWTGSFRFSTCTYSAQTNA
jgi:hypothetical protein